MVISPFRKLAFPGKYCPWNFKDHRDLDVPINDLYKHHLHLLPSSSNAALYMPPDTGGLGLSWLSDQILMEKWAMIWRGLHLDHSTRVATEGLLHRALRLGHTSTDFGYRSAFAQCNISQILTGLIKLTSSIGLTLCKGGAPPQDTPSQPLAQALQLTLHSKIDKKLMNHRITTIADLMTSLRTKTTDELPP